MTPEDMKRFLIQTSVENAEGSQTWYVDAETEGEALKKYNDGDCNIYSNEAEVTSLGEPELAGETTLDDFGDFAIAQQRKPLTLEQLREHWQVAKVLDMTDAEIDFADYVLITRDVEALHGIKE